MTTILTHRGLDPDRTPWFLESSDEAFTDHLKRGYGLEFDVRPTKDGGLVIIHDANLSRMTNGADTRAIASLSTDEILTYPFVGGSITTLQGLLSRIAEHGAEDAVHALHLKAVVQIDAVIAEVARQIATAGLDNIIIFDVTIETARRIRQLSSIALAPSVAHPYDIERYQTAVGGTLISVEDAVAHRDLFDWVWLDEWDTRDADGAQKKFYISETFALLREAGVKISLVTPELHGTSPGLLGGEAHEDAKDMTTLMRRIGEILTLAPDIVCTDHPDAVAGMLID